MRVTVLLCTLTVVQNPPPFSLLDDRARRPLTYMYRVAYINQSVWFNILTFHLRMAVLNGTAVVPVAMQ